MLKWALGMSAPKIQDQKSRLVLSFCFFLWTVETGYNYTPTITNNNNEIDELTKKIEQLSLNYTNVASALAVQLATQTFTNNRGQNRRSNFQRNSQG